MQKKLSWRLEPPKGLISTSKEHMPLCHTVHEEDPVLLLDHFCKVEEEEMQVPCNKGDAVMEVDAEADGSVVAKVDNKVLHKLELVHSASAVASMDTTLRSVLKEPVDPAVAILHSLSTSAVILHRLEASEVEDKEEIVEVDDGLDFPDSMSFMIPRETSTRWMKTATSY